MPPCGSVPPDWPVANSEPCAPRRYPKPRVASRSSRRAARARPRPERSTVRPLIFSQPSSVTLFPYVTLCRTSCAIRQQFSCNYFPLGDNGPVSNKEHRLSVRVDARLKKRLEEAEKTTGIDEATIVRQCLVAFCEHVEVHGRAVFPLTIGGHAPAPRRAAGGDPVMNEPACPPPAGSRQKA